jgi:hypothetical protein
MKDRMLNLTDRFGFDPDLLSAIEDDDWFNENSEPHPGEDYKPLNSIEELMSQFVRSDRFIMTQGQF